MSALPVPVRSVKPTEPTQARTLKVHETLPICPRLVLYGVEGWGKTTVGGHAPDPVIFMARDERGVDRLRSSGRLPAIPSERIETWADTLSWLDAMLDNPQGRKALVMDALGGFERLCHEHVCNTEFKGDWSDKGFMGYMRGYELAIPEWLKLLQRLDALNRGGLVVILLGHARTKNFKNPLGADFDRYECDVHPKTWAVTARWADAVLFGNFLSVIEFDRKTGNVAKDKGKGIGGTKRVVYAERRDAFDAKNGYGMPTQFDMPEKYDQSWTRVWDAITKGQ